MSVILSPRGNEASNMMKRFVRYEEAAQYFGIDETLIVAYAKVAGAVYQLSKIRLIKIEPLEDYMKHLTRVGRSSKLIQSSTARRIMNWSIPRSQSRSVWKRYRMKRKIRTGRTALRTV